MIKSGFGPLAELMSITFDEVHERYEKNLEGGILFIKAIASAKKDAGKHLAELMSLRGFEVSSHYDDETSEEGVTSCVCRSFTLTFDKADFISLLIQEFNVHLDVELKN